MSIFVLNKHTNRASTTFRTRNSLIPNSPEDSLRESFMSCLSTCSCISCCISSHCFAFSFFVVFSFFPFQFQHNTHFFSFALPCYIPVIYVKWAFNETCLRNVVHALTVIDFGFWLFVLTPSLWKLLFLFIGQDFLISLRFSVAPETFTSSS